MTKVLGLGGFKESGKDAFADGLPPDKWVVIGMSDPLVRAVGVVNPYLPDVQMYLADYWVEQEGDYARMKEQSPEYRRILQVFGTDFGRDMVDANIWVDMALDQIQRFRDKGLNVAVTGIRFPNEIEAIRSIGGQLLWIERDGVDSTKDAHASENSVSKRDFDEVVHNDSTIAELHKKAHRLALAS